MIQSMKWGPFFNGLLFLFAVTTARSQDIHWSQFNDNPLNQSPGNTGQFKGDYRFVGNYRTQWKSVSIPFQTISLSVDSRLKNHRDIGVGLQFFHDAVGDGKLQTIEIQSNVSYPFLFLNDDLLIRPGLNLGFNSRSLNPNAFYYGNQFNGVTLDPSLPTGENFAYDRKSNFSIGVGSAAVYKINPKNESTLGFGLFNLNRPNQGFFNEKVNRSIRSNVNLQHRYTLRPNIDLMPSINWSKQDSYTEFILGSTVKYTLINRMGVYRAVYGGLWYRARDAVYLTVGMDYQDWFFGLSYDVNLSKLVPASNVRGGFEIAVRYILTSLKPKKIDHRICPDYI